MTLPELLTKGVEALFLYDQDVLNLQEGLTGLLLELGPSVPLLHPGEVDSGGGLALPLQPELPSFRRPHADVAAVHLVVRPDATQRLAELPGIAGQMSCIGAD